MCHMLQIGQKKMNSRLTVLTVRHILAISQTGPEYQMGWRGRDAPFCLDLIDSLRWVCKFTFLKKAWSVYNDSASAPLEWKKWAPREWTNVPAWIVYWPHNPALWALPAMMIVVGHGWWWRWWWRWKWWWCWRKGGMLHCLDLIDSLGWLANLCFSKSVFLRLTLTFNSAKSFQNIDSESCYNYNHHKK